jgi:1,4-alpha-glucan branching enzyme
MAQGDAPGAGDPVGVLDSYDSVAPIGSFMRQPRLQAMTEEADATAPVQVQFVFEGRAERVSLVGDFNAWSADSTPMQRVGELDAWVATVNIVPGRHVYAFVLDGQRWVADPHAPPAPDDDFGKPGSVIMVRPR